MKFSLILCSVGDYSHIRGLFDSLVSQTYHNFEVILVDQNTDNRLCDLVKEYEERISIVHINSDKGLSLARNVGIKYATGDVFAFPDDDCTYPNQTLEGVNTYLSNNSYDGVVIRAVNSVSSGRILHEHDPSQLLTKRNCLSLVHSISLFFKRELIESVGDFDTNLGLGANTIFQGQEDRDYPIRALNKGFILYYNRDITVLHPWDDPEIDQHKNLIERAFKGAAAEVYLLNKHGYSFWFKLFRLIRKIAAVIYFAIIKRNMFKMRSSISGLKGMVQYFNTKPQI